MKAEPKPGRWAFVLTALAFTWGLALIGAALIVHVYSSETASAPAGAAVGAASSTLVQVNGFKVLIPRACWRWSRQSCGSRFATSAHGVVTRVG
ncbi:MAG: hypothetical protein ACLP0J_29550 [Solirubrobacteraceae bacterium]